MPSAGSASRSESEYGERKTFEFRAGGAAAIAD
jgi:hypothetical protein